MLPSVSFRGEGQRWSVKGKLDGLPNHLNGVVKGKSLPSSAIKLRFFNRLAESLVNKITELPGKHYSYTTMYLHDIAKITAIVALVRSTAASLKTKLYGLSLQANYTDRATAACRRSDCQLFADRRCHVVSVTDPYGRIVGFLNRSPTFSSKQLFSCTHEAEWTPLQTHYFFLVVPGIEPGPPDLSKSKYI
jgi:hypothetical protein